MSASHMPIGNPPSTTAATTATSSDAARIHGPRAPEAGRVLSLTRAVARRSVAARGTSATDAGEAGLLDRLGNQLAGFDRFAAIEGGDSTLQQLLGLPVTLGQRGARALDVGASPIVPALEKDDPRPDVDGLLELARKILIETREKELLDPGFAVGLAWLARGLGWFGAQRIRHQPLAIIARSATKHTTIGHEGHSAANVATKHDTRCLVGRAVSQGRCHATDTVADLRG